MGSGQRGRDGGGGAGGRRFGLKRELGGGQGGEAESRVRGVEMDPGVRLSLVSRFPLTPPRLPSLLGSGPEPQTLRHNSPAGAGGEATAKLSANFAAWRDVGCEAGLIGAGARS